MSFRSRHYYVQNSTGEEFDVLLTIDIDALAKRLGVNALNNKSKRASIFHGCVKAEILDPKDPNPK